MRVKGTNGRTYNALRPVEDQVGGRPGLRGEGAARGRSATARDDRAAHRAGRRGQEPGDRDQREDRGARQATRGAGGRARGDPQWRASWHAARERLGDLEEWCHRVAANFDALGYDERRMLLDAPGVQVKVWNKGHEPRWEITARIPLGEADEQIVSTTSSWSGRSKRRQAYAPRPRGSGPGRTDGRSLAVAVRITPSPVASGVALTGPRPPGIIIPM